MKKIDQALAQPSDVLLNATDPADLGVMEASMLMRRDRRPLGVARSPQLWHTDSRRQP